MTVAPAAKTAVTLATVGKVNGGLTGYMNATLQGALNTGWTVFLLGTGEHVLTKGKASITVKWSAKGLPTKGKGTGLEEIAGKAGKPERVAFALGLISADQRSGGWYMSKADRDAVAAGTFGKPAK